MRNRTTTNTVIPKTSRFRNFALCALTFAFSILPPHKPPILPKLPTIYCLFMQNKPNFRKSQMNLSVYLEKAYENKSNWTLGENKPNQTQFVVSLCQRCLSNLFQTGRPLMDSRKYKKYLTFPLGADRICCVPEVICCNRNNEKGFQTCL